MCTIIVPGRPHGKARPRFARGHAYTPKVTLDYEALVADCYRSAGGEYYGSGEMIRIDIAAFYPIAKRDDPEKQELKRQNLIRPCDVRPDLDNVVKIILDGINGVGIEDDHQVVSICANKFYSDDPRVEFVVSRIA